MYTDNDILSMLLSNCATNCQILCKDFQTIRNSLHCYYSITSNILMRLIFCNQAEGEDDVPPKPRFLIQQRIPNSNESKTITPFDPRNEIGIAWVDEGGDLEILCNVTQNTQDSSGMELELYKQVNLSFN